MSLTLPEEILSENPAVAACMRAWQDDYQMSKHSNLSDYVSKQNARSAYRAAMPDLNDEQSIRDFIACIGRGILLEVFSDRESAKLIAAAQAARHSAKAIRKQMQEEESLAKPSVQAAAPGKNYFS